MFGGGAVTIEFQMSKKGGRILGTYHGIPYTTGHYGLEILMAIATMVQYKWRYN